MALYKHTSRDGWVLPASTCIRLSSCCVQFFFPSVEETKWYTVIFNSKQKPMVVTYCILEYICKCQETVCNCTCVIIQCLYYLPLHLSRIGEYRKGSNPSISPSISLHVLVHSSIMVGWIFFILGTMIKYHGLLMYVK